MGFSKLVFACVCFVGFAASGRDLTPAEKKEDIEQLASMIRSNYGPYDLKRAKLGIDLDKLVAQYTKDSETLTNMRFYHLLNQFVAEFKDSHFKSLVQSNFLATLGFTADRINGVVLIDQINRAMLPEEKFPFERGDEIVEMDGRPIADVVAGLAKYISAGYKETGLRMASMFLAYRPAALLPPTNGLAKLMIRRGTSTIIEKVKLPWLTAGQLDVDTAPLDPLTETWSSVSPDYEKLSVEDLYSELPKVEHAFRCQGITRTAIPKDAVPVVTTPFVAYYHPTDKGNVGYLRIPHYSWGADSELRFKQYEYAVSELEKHTVGLIIDQDHNCGGSVGFLERLLGLFAPRPYKGLEFQFLATRSEYLSFKDWVDGDAKYTLEGNDLLGVVGLVKTAWQGRSRLSAKTTFQNGRLLQPHGTRYTKPIIVLIDEMSGSGGDAFPAMMQGLGHTLMGNRTMGAGGHVTPMPNLNYSSNRVNMTKSLFFRPDGVEVENNGAVPTIAYQPTRDDFLYQYRSYQKRYLEELAKLIH